jgi:hypothetical protein
MKGRNDKRRKWRGREGGERTGKERGKGEEGKGKGKGERSRGYSPPNLELCLRPCGMLKP